MCPRGCLFALCTARIESEGLAKKREQRTTLNIDYLDLVNEQIPLIDHSIDTVVSTFTLCTIADIGEALRGIARVLKQSGQFIFFELGIAPEPSVQKWQRRLEPVCHWLFQGLHLTRDIPSLLTQQGFQFMQLKAGYLAQFPKSLSYAWWGIAVVQN